MRIGRKRAERAERERKKGTGGRSSFPSRAGAFLKKVGKAKDDRKKGKANCNRLHSAETHYSHYPHPPRGFILLQGIGLVKSAGALHALWNQRVLVDER